MLGPGRRLRKQWRYIGVFCEEFMLCAARAQVGPAGQTFWAVIDRSSGEMIERTRKRMPFGRGDVWSLAAEGSDWPIGSIRARRRHLDRRQGGAGRAQGGGGQVGRVRLPERRRRLGLDPQADRADRVRRAAARRPPLAYDRFRDRGRVGRLPPAPHGLVLVGRRRRHARRPRARLEPGQRRQRSRPQQRARDLGRRRALRARAGRASSTTSPRSASAPPTAAAGSASSPRPSAGPRRTSASSSSATGSRSAASAATSAASSSPRG